MRKKKISKQFRRTPYAQFQGESQHRAEMLGFKSLKQQKRCKAE